MRARFADDALAAAVASGVRQLVVLAAGLDSSCLRRDPRVRVIEVDHPASQRAKRERLAALGAPIGGVEFLAVDFEREELAAALARSSLDRTQPAFVTWIGVTMYLPVAIGLATLAQIRASVAAGQRARVRLPDPAGASSTPRRSRSRASRTRASRARRSRASPPTTRTTSRARSPNAASR